ADRIVLGKQLVGSGLAEHAHFGSRAHVRFAEHLAVGKVPLTNHQVIDAFTGNLGAPIIVAGHDLAASTDLRANRRYARDFPFDRSSILDSERARAAKTGEDAS